MGLSPLVLRSVSSLSLVPWQLQPLLQMSSNRSVRHSLSKHFLADFSILSSVPSPPNRPLYAPKVLLKLRRGSLTPLGILLASPHRAPITLTPKSPPTRWLLAKLHVSQAMAQVHEFQHHLPLHLLMETVALSTHNKIGAEHWVGRLLKPHLQGTILINLAAKETLLEPSPDNIAESSFAVGMEGALALARTGYNFTWLDFPSMMSAQGFPSDRSEGLQHFHYRDYGFRLWRILHRFVSSVVSLHYPTHQSVAEDLSLQSWARSLAPIGFPSSLPTTSSLSHALTTIIFGASAQHQVLSGLQRMYWYAPSLPSLLRSWLPPGEDDLSPELLAEALPAPDTALRVGRLAAILTKPSGCNLLEGLGSGLAELYNNNNNSYSNRTSDEERSQFLDYLAEAQSEMEDMSADIRAREYPYLDPKHVACSIDI